MWLVLVSYCQDRLIREQKRKDMVSKDEIGPMLTVREVARLLHVHTNTVRRWSDQGILKAYHIGSRGDRRFRREDINDFPSELASDSRGEEQPTSTGQTLGDNELLTDHKIQGLSRR